MLIRINRACFTASLAALQAASQLFLDFHGTPVITGLESDGKSGKS